MKLPLFSVLLIFFCLDIVFAKNSTANRKNSTRIQTAHFRNLTLDINQNVSSLFDTNQTSYEAVNLTNCVLERLLLKRQANGSSPRLPLCSKRGNYVVQKCRGNSCWCVDEVTGKKIRGTKHPQFVGSAYCGKPPIDNLTLITIAEDTDGPKQRQQIQLQSDPGPVCLNRTFPFRDSDSGKILSSDLGCEALHCPQGWTCRFSYSVASDLFVCCNETYEEQFEDIYACPNGKDPLVRTGADGIPIAIYGESCEKIDCLETHQCLKSRYYAKCCPKPTKGLPVDRECPVGHPLKDSKGLPITCGVFYNDAGTTCPPKSFCSETEDQSFCCPSPVLPGPLQNVLDARCADDVALNFSRCVDENFEASVFDQLSTIGSTPSILNISSLAAGKNATLLLLSNLTSLQKRSDPIELSEQEAAIRSTIKAICQRYFGFKECVRPLDVKQCPVLQFAQKLLSGSLELICNPELLNEAVEASACLSIVAKTDEGSKCAERVTDAIAAQLDVGFEHGSAELCRSLHDSLECMEPPASKVCGEPAGNRHVNFMRRFLGGTLDLLFGSQCGELISGNASFSASNFTRFRRDRKHELANSLQSLTSSIVDRDTAPDVITATRFDRDEKLAASKMTKEEKKCQASLAEVGKVGTFLVGSYVPRCDDNGNYRPLQCHGVSGYCWCVNPESGTKIPGTEVAPGYPTPNCNN